MICSQGTFKFQGPGVQDLRRSELNMQLVVSTGSDSDRKRVVVVLTLLLICSVVIKGFRQRGVPYLLWFFFLFGRWSGSHALNQTCTRSLL